MVNKEGTVLEVHEDVAAMVWLDEADLEGLPDAGSTYGSSCSDEDGMAWLMDSPEDRSGSGSSDGGVSEVVSEVDVEEGMRWIHQAGKPLKMAWVRMGDGKMGLQAVFDLTPESVGSLKRKVEVKNEDEMDQEGSPDSDSPSSPKAHKIRRYVNPTASRFCHICARSGDGVPIFTCKNVEHAVCRKVICQRCIQKYGWETPADPTAFVCCHCKGECPEKAQCITYRKTNQRRRAKGEQHRKMIEQAIANGENVTELLDKLPQ